MSDLPNGWETAEALEVCRAGEPAIMTGPFGSNLGREDFVSSGVPVFTIGCLGRDFIDRDKLSFVSKAKAAELMAYRLLEGDLLFSRMADVGRVGFVPAELEGAIYNYHLMRIRLDARVIEPRYFYLYVRGAERVQAYLEDVNRGATRDGINTKLLSSLPVSLPPLAEQRRIVAKLDQVMARTARARAELARIPALIAQHKRAILAAASAGDLTADFRAKSTLKKWTPTNVERSATVVFDGPFGSHLKSDDYSETGVRVVRLENIGHLRFIEDKRTYVPPEKYASLTRHSLYAGDVVFSSFVDEEVRVCVLPADIDQPTINKADCFCVRTDSAKCDAEFLAYRLACHSTYEALEDAVHGATRPRISLKQLRAFEFDLPSLPEQHEIVRRIKSAFAWLDKVAHEHAQATRLLDHLDQALLARAFRGELVSQDPADEPAATLLARIRAEREGAAPAARKRKARA